MNNVEKQNGTSKANRREYMTDVESSCRHTQSLFVEGEAAIAKITQMKQQRHTSENRQKPRLRTAEQIQ